MNTTTTTKATPTIEATVTGTDLLTASLALMFSNGEALHVSPATLSEEIRHAAMMHGLKQKLVDAAAIARNQETGKSATVVDKYNAVREVCERLKAGQWNKPREGVSAAGGLLLRALMEFSGKAKPDAEAWLAVKTDAERAALRKNPRIAAIIASLKPEPSTSDIDTDALLGELGA